MRRRKAERIQQLREAAVRARTAGGVLVRVAQIRQYARTGTKCYLRHPNGAIEAAWFRNVWPRRGELIIISGGHAGGEHHHEYVFYVNHIFEALDPSLWRYRRHLTR